MRLEDQTYEKMMNLITNHSFGMIGALMGQERQENYTYISVIVLMALVLFFVFAACMKNTTERTADQHAHRTLEMARNASIQQMIEMSNVDSERHERLLHGDSD